VSKGNRSDAEKRGVASDLASGLSPIDSSGKVLIAGIADIAAS